MSARKVRQRNRRRLAAASADPEKRILTDWSKSVLTFRDIALINRASLQDWGPSIPVRKAVVAGMMHTLRNAPTSKAVAACATLIRMNLRDIRRANEDEAMLAAMEQPAPQPTQFELVGADWWSLPPEQVDPEYAAHLRRKREAEAVNANTQAENRP